MENKEKNDQEKNNQERNSLEMLAGLAVSGDRKALESLLEGVQDMVFNLSLRMLGTVADAEDASQEILIKVMTHLSDFRRESRFTTWVFSIALNHLKSYKKHMFYQRPLSFEYYGEDIASGREGDVPDLTGGVDRAVLADELKLSCTNVMLQCLDSDSRCVFILGTMFRLDSRIAGEILGISPDTYRKRLSRIREKVAAFLGEYCGLAGGMCCCNRRVDYAIATRRMTPGYLEYSRLTPGESLVMGEFREAMEEMDDLSQIFADLPFYRSGPEAKQFIVDVLRSQAGRTVLESQSMADGS